MTSLAQMERELIVERTRAGLEAARKRGRIGGRKRLMTPSKVESAKNLKKMGFHLVRWLKILVFQSPRFIDGALLLIETDIRASQLKKQYSNKTKQFRGAVQNTL